MVRNTRNISTFHGPIFCINGMATGKNSGIFITATKYLIMKQTFCIAALLLLIAHINGQNRQVIRVPAGNDIAAAVSDYGMYRLPSFSTGTVYFKDGNIGREMMNYNILTAQMLYIDKKGDTLAIAIPDEIKKLDINGAIYYYNSKTWLEEIAAAPAVSLVARRDVNIHFEKKGAFGSSDPSGSISSYNTYFAGAGNGNASYRLQVNEDAVVKRETSYFLLSKYNVQMPATKKGFLHAFPHNNIKIESYLADNKVDFNNLGELIQLLGIAAAVNERPQF